MLFKEVLASDLTAFPGNELNCSLILYVDDLLLTSLMREDCWAGTQMLLTLPSDSRYEVSWKKALICLQKVNYLDFLISEGHWTLEP